MIGVVACEALYNVVERHVPDATVAYVSPDRHEFPVNVPDATAVSAALQDRIDRVDDPARDRVVVAYADDGESLAGIRSRHAPLVVARGTNCTAALLPARPSSKTGERRPAGTYTLSRGWIDCAVDSYKLYAAYTGDDQSLVEEFERAAATHPDVRFTWNRGKLYKRALETGPRVSGDQIGRFVHRIVEYYDRVELIDTGDLHDHHCEYADRFRAFLERLSREYGDGQSVALDVRDADGEFLRRLLATESPRSLPNVEVYAPGTPVE